MERENQREREREAEKQREGGRERERKRGGGRTGPDYLGRAAAATVDVNTRATDRELESIYTASVFQAAAAPGGQRTW